MDEHRKEKQNIQYVHNKPQQHSVLREESRQGKADISQKEI